MSAAPLRFGARLALSLGALCVAQGLLSGMAAWALGAPLHEAARLAATAAALLVALVGLGVVVLVKRTASLYRAAARAEVPGSVPPSQSALRDALAAPTWLSLLVALPLPAGVGIASGGDVLLALVAVCGGLWSLAPAAILVRRALASWLVSFRAEDQALDRGRPTPAMPGVETALPIIAAAWAGAAVIGAVAAPVALVVSVAALLLGARFSRALGADVRALRARVGEAAGRVAEGTLHAIDLGRASFRTQQVSELAAELEAMIARYSGSARHEERARESVQDLQQKKMLFMASMSHDLRSPLNSILGFAELLGRPTSGLADAQRESVRTISRSGEELLHLLNDVLDAARFEAGKLVLHRDWTPSVEILTEAVRQGRELIADRELDIVAELQPGLPPVRVDRARIVQAVVCLFRHAARAMERGTIRMYARVGADPETQEARLRVDVVDPSGGIRDEDRERIFEAFREVTAISGRRIGGLGLSVSLARSLVRAHGGDVWIGTAGGKETTFTVSIPV